MSYRNVPPATRARGVASVPPVLAVLACLAASPALAGSLTVCNKLSEPMTGLDLFGGGTPDAAASAGVLVPGACATWRATPDGAGAVALHYILGKGDHVLLCSVMTQTTGAVTVSISPTTDANCIR